MLKLDTIDYLRKEWQDEEDFIFMRDSCLEIVQRYKNAIKRGDFAFDPTGVSLWASVYEWLKNLNESIKPFVNTKKERKKVRESFLWVLIQEILIPNTKIKK